jgi:chaperonin GroEL
MTDLIAIQKIAGWEKLKTLVLDSVSSPITKRVYNMALDEFLSWFQQAPRPGFTKATVSAWRVAHAMVKGGHLAIIRGHPPIEVIQGMELAVKTAISSLRDQAMSAAPENLLRIARTAAGDERLASVVVDAMERAGNDGVITIESSDNPEPVLTVLEGFRFDRGYLSETFITEIDTKECVLDECRLLICDRRITNLQQILPALEQVARSKESLIVIADDVEGEALATLVVNRLRGALAVVAVKAPGTGDRRRHLLHDMAILTGAKAITSESGIDISAIRLDDFGTAQKVVVTKDTTTITGGHGNQRVIESHIHSLRGEIDRTTDGFEREKLQERLTNLAGGVATIRVGGKAHAEAEDQLYRAASALHSTRAAVEEGFVYGGGVGLIKAALEVSKLTFVSEAQKAGANVISESLEVAFRALAENAGMNPNQAVSDHLALGSQSFGFDAQRGCLHESGDKGALDPAKVLRVGVEAAFSFARGILKTGAWSQGQEKA